MSFLSCIGKKSRKKKEKRNEPLERNVKGNVTELDEDAVSTGIDQYIYIEIP